MEDSQTTKSKLTLLSIEYSLVLAATLYYCGVIFRSNYLIKFGINSLIDHGTYDLMYYGMPPVIASTAVCLLFLIVASVTSNRYERINEITKWMFKSFSDYSVEDGGYFRLFANKLPVFGIIFFVFTGVSAGMGHIAYLGAQNRSNNIDIYLHNSSERISGIRIASDGNHIVLLKDGEVIEIVKWEAVKRLKVRQ